MDPDAFSQSTIGADYLRTDQYYPVDLLLDYLHGLIEMKTKSQGNEVWEEKYSTEIDAVKEILKKQTNGKRA